MNARILNGLVLAVSLGVIFIIAEVAYRILDPFPFIDCAKTNATEFGNLLQYDPVLGWSGIPNIKEQLANLGDSEVTPTKNPNVAYVPSFQKFVVYVTSPGVGKTAVAVCAEYRDAVDVRLKKQAELDRRIKEIEGT